MTDLTDLIAKLEAAPEGSNQLSHAVYGVSQGHEVRWVGDIAEILITGCGCEGRRESHEHWKRCGPQPGGGVFSGPHYTTSLDAKLPGEDIDMVISVVPGKYMASQRGITDKGVATGRAATEPLARRIAALKATAA